MPENSTIELDKKRSIKSAGLLKKRAVLLVLSDNLFGKSFLLDKKSAIIGRGVGCDINIKDPLASKKHCRIFSDEAGSFFLEDIGSTNSTYLNGKITEKAVQISYGDRIIIGNTVLRFFLAENFESKK